MQTAWEGRAKESRSHPSYVPPHLRSSHGGHGRSALTHEASSWRGGRAGNLIPARSWNAGPVNPAAPPSWGGGYSGGWEGHEVQTESTDFSGWGRPNEASSAGWGSNNEASYDGWGSSNDAGSSFGEQQQRVHAETSAVPNNNLFTDQTNSGCINFEAYDDIPVETSGENVPPPVNSFAEIDLGTALQENIRRCKYVKPTPVQRHAIPISLAGRDLMACAQTGSGKTAAFCFPIIAGILGRPRNVGSFSGARTATCYPLALILSPTRELSCQIHAEARKFSHETGLRVAVVYGGAPMRHQLKEIERGVDILVATPGRLEDMLERERISLSQVRYLALDEADRMLDMGFEPQIRRIVEQKDMPAPGQRQTLLFSATFPTEIQRLAADFLSNYIFLTVGRVGSSTDLIVQKVEHVSDYNKRSNLMGLIHGQDFEGKQLMLVFVETKKGADRLVDWLCRMGIRATSIHGDRNQQEREHALRTFRSGATPILVATDVAARGLDIPQVAHVVNFDLPKDIDDYVHRIGRTGRAGKTGLATAFFTDNNSPLARPLAEVMQESNQEVPEWLSNYASRASYGNNGGRNRRFGGGSKFGSRDYRRESGSANGAGRHENFSGGSWYGEEPYGGSQIAYGVYGSNVSNNSSMWD